MEAIYIIWFMIIIVSFLVRRARTASGRKAQSSVSPAPSQFNRAPQPQMPGTEAAYTPVVNVPRTPQRTVRAPLQRGRKVSDATCETQYGHVHPERGKWNLHFYGREDLEPGYMYLNGVKVLIKEADKLEFLR